MSEAAQYKCPNCGGELKFNPDKQKFTCEYCLGEFSQKDLDDFYKKEEENKIENPVDMDIPKPQSENEINHNEKVGTQEQQDEFSNNTNLYVCPSCGAEIVSDENTAATFCCFCHNPVILKGRVDGKYRPSMVLPFKLSREKALENFEIWAKRKWFIPKKLLATKTLEKMTGLYVPFWVSDSDTDSSYQATGKKVRTWRSGDTEYTETKVYNVQRAARIKYSGVPADGSKKIEDKLMEAIEPFDYTQAVPFSMSYLSGFLADKYDVYRTEVWPNIRNRINISNMELLRNTAHGYTCLENERYGTTYKDVKWQYMLLPVWFMSYNYRGKMWSYAINGQSGKISGKLPVSVPKVLSFGLIVLIISIIITLIIGGFIE